MIDRLNAALEGRYRIERELGVGGMATVYLAADLRHDRKVALKVVKPELSALLGGDRFVHEIKTTAGLQHPNVLPLFDSGSAAGFLFYVMPYVEGETLRSRLEREQQIGIEDAVRITTEIADALDHAHRRGVVHRDIKPENILLQDGRPLVADFGIALAVSAAAGLRMTGTGLSLGTPHYMSPEQATAEKAITHRSDIYSLGAVLYEMLTGRPPHTGASAQQIIMKVVTEEPAAVATIRRTVPAHVAAAVRQALQKLPADRFGSGAEFAAALRNPAFGTASAFAAPRRPNVMTRHPAAAVIAAAAVAVISMTFAVRAWRRPEPVTVRFVTMLMQNDARDGEAFAGTVAISPDGATIVFRAPASGDGQLFVKRREDHAARPLPGTEGGTGPFFSPDGDWIGFFAGRQMRRIPAAGGSSLVLADSVDPFYAGGAWLADGTIIYKSSSDLWRLPSGSGTPRMVASLATLDGDLPWLPTPLPASRGVLFTTCTNSGPSTCSASRVWVYDARRDTARVLFEPALGAWHVSTGHLLYLTPSGTLMVLPWDNNALAATGPAVPVADGIQAPGLVLSAEGTALYVVGPPLYATGPAPNADLAWVDRRGHVEDFDLTWRFNTGTAGWGLALSPDGSRLAIRLRTDLGSDIWIKQLPTGPLSRLTFHEGDDATPAWSPDGRSVTFVSDRRPSGDTALARRAGLWEQSADGTGDARLLHSGVSTRGVRSPDGRWVIVATASADSASSIASDIVAIRPEVNASEMPIVATPAVEQSPALSHDGRWLAYLSNETGRFEVFVRPFPESDRGVWQVSTGGGAAPIWSNRGFELFYLQDDTMKVVEFRPGPPVTTGQPRSLFGLPEGVRGTRGSPLASPAFAISPDDQRFLTVRNVTPWDTTAQPTLVMVQHFHEELKARSRLR
jgi:serine/threonine-protein kinase